MSRLGRGYPIQAIISRGPTSVPQTYAKTGIIISEAKVLGPDSFNTTETGIVISEAKALGPDTFATAETGTIISEGKTSAADEFDSTETGMIQLGSGGVSHPGSAPTSSLLDNFNRTENPLSTGWAGPFPGIPGTHQMRISGNRAIGTGNFGVVTTCECSSYRTTQYGPDCEVSFDVFATSGNGAGIDDMYAFLRMDGSGNGYQVHVQIANQIVSIDKLVAGAETQLASVSHAWSGKLWFIIGGTTLYVYEKPSTTWNLILQVTDATYSAAGYLGFGCNDTATTYDNFIAGTVLMSGKIGPVLSGIHSGNPIKTGVIVTEAKSSGLDVFASTETGKVISQPVPSGGDTWATADTGAIVSKIIPSGSDSFSPIETGTIKLGSGGLSTPPGTPVGSILDNFNRVENPLSTGWVGPLIGGHQMRTFSNHAIGTFAPAGGSTTCEDSSYYNTVYGPDTEVAVDIITLSGTPANDDLYLFLRMTAANGNGYQMRYSPSGAFIAIDRLDSGVETRIATSGFVLTPSAIRFVVVGSKFFVFTKISSVWGLVLTVTSATYSAAGYTGIGANDTNTALDNFIASTLSIVLDGVIGSVLSGSDVFTPVEAGSIVSEAKTSAVDVDTLNKTGKVISQPIPSAADAWTTVETGKIISEAKILGAHGGTSIHTGLVISEAKTSGADTFSPIETGIIKLGSGGLSQLSPPPVSSILDNFNRSENPLSTGWSGPLIPGDAQMRTFSNHGIGTIAAGAQPVCVNNSYRTTQYGPDVEVSFDLTTVSGGGAGLDDIYAFARMDLSGNGYQAHLQPAAGLASIDKLVAGVETQLILVSMASAGSVIWFGVYGSKLRLFVKVSGVWTLLAQVTDTTYASSGYVGFGSNDTNTAYDNFIAGTMVVDGVVGPTLSGGDVFTPAEAGKIISEAKAAGPEFHTADHPGKIISEAKLIGIDVDLFVRAGLIKSRSWHYVWGIGGLGPDTTGLGDGFTGSFSNICTDASGELYAACDFPSGNIQKFEPVLGAFDGRIGNTGTGSASITDAYDCKISFYDGLMYPTNHGTGGVAAFNKSTAAFVKDIAYIGTGHYLSSKGSNGSGNSQFLSPDSCAIGASHYYVMDSVRGDIQKFTISNNTFVLAFGVAVSGFSGLSSPFGMCIDPSTGDLLVCDTGNKRVVRFDTSTGAVISTFGSSGVGNGQFQNPVCISVTSAGKIRVGDSTRNDIQAFNTSQVFTAIEYTGVYLHDVSLYDNHVWTINSSALISHYNSSNTLVFSNTITIPGDYTKWGITADNDAGSDYKYRVFVNFYSGTSSAQVIQTIDQDAIAVIAGGSPTPIWGRNGNGTTSGANNGKFYLGCSSICARAGLMIGCDTQLYRIHKGDVVQWRHIIEVYSVIPDGIGLVYITDGGVGGTGSGLGAGTRVLDVTTNPATYVRTLNIQFFGNTQALSHDGTKIFQAGQWLNSDLSGSPTNLLDGSSVAIGANARVPFIGPWTGAHLFLFDQSGNNGGGVLWEHTQAGAFVAKYNLSLDAVKSLDTIANLANDYITNFQIGSGWASDPSIAMSPDQRYMYLDNWSSPYIYKFDLQDLHAPGAQLGGADIFSASETGSPKSKVIPSAADVFQTVETGLVASEAKASGVRSGSGTHSGAIVSKVIPSAADIFASSETGSIISEAKALGADVFIVTDSGIIISAAVAKAADSLQTVETGSIISALVASGSDVSIPAKTGIIISQGILNGPDIFSAIKTGLIISEAKTSGADVFVPTETAIIISKIIPSGADALFATETGLIISEAKASGIEIFSLSKSGIIISEGKISGIESRNGAKTGILVSKVIPSGADAWSLFRSGSIVSDSILSGGDTFNSPKTGSVISAFSIFGSDIYLAGKSGSIIAKIIPSAVDIFTATETGLLISEAVISGVHGSAFTKSVIIISQAKILGSDILTSPKSGSLVSESIISGGALSAIPKSGIIISPTTIFGSDAFTSPKTGSIISEITAFGVGRSLGAKFGTINSKIVPSAIDQATFNRQSMIISEAVLSGYRIGILHIKSGSIVSTLHLMGHSIDEVAAILYNFIDRPILLSAGQTEETILLSTYFKKLSGVEDL